VRSLLVDSPEDKLRERRGENARCERASAGLQQLPRAISLRRWFKIRLRALLRLREWLVFRRLFGYKGHI